MQRDWRPDCIEGINRWVYQDYVQGLREHDEEAADAGAKMCDVSPSIPRPFEAGPALTVGREDLRDYWRGVLAALRGAGRRLLHLQASEGQG